MLTRAKVINSHLLLDPSSAHATFIFVLDYSLDFGHITQRPYRRFEEFRMVLILNRILAETELMMWVF